MFMAAMAMALPWKIVEDFQSFVKKKINKIKNKKTLKTSTLTLKICILQEHGFKELTLVLLDSLF